MLSRRRARAADDGRRLVHQGVVGQGVHHEQGVHAYNYGDLPLWDMMFGTFKNPRVFDEKCGFAHDRELELSAMLRGVDVNLIAGADPNSNAA